MTPLPLHLVFVCLAINIDTEGRIVHGIIGRNVTFSMTFETGDLVHIMHNDSAVVMVWPNNNDLIKQIQQRDRVGIVIDNATRSSTVNVIINIMNLTTSDHGMYTVVRPVNPKNIQDSIFLETIDETMRPTIEIFSNHTLDSTLVLKCNVCSTSTGKVLWSLNGSLIDDHTKYVQHNLFLYIRNLTADEKYNFYTCKESGSELESDPYSIPIWIDHFTTKATTLLRDTAENNHYTAQTLRKNEDTEVIYTYMMTATSSHVNVQESPSERRLLYIIFGMGAIIAVAITACFLHKIKNCFRGVRASDISTGLNSDDGSKNVQDVNQAEYYWTIVCNAKNEMSTAIETHGGVSGDIPMVRTSIVPTSSSSNESIRADDIYVSQEIHRYSNPIISCTVQFNDYIHPIHSTPLNKYMLSDVKEYQACKKNLSIHRDAKSVSI
ncbi:hypothetical protein ACJMK2_025647 [Sinanodonta woodiana]|uniref:Ig-like domain-containing protein n=1 Tax=Sinanodonta woodiana TaxID=1069815 RepID=A0ABD3XHN9_SINWO